MKTLRYSARVMTSFGMLLAISSIGRNCQAADVYFIADTMPPIDGDFNSGANWSDGLVPSLVITPPSPVPNVYGIDDGLSATFFGGTTRVKALRVGSAAKEHPLGETHFGRLTMLAGSLEVIGNNTLAVGRENLSNYPAPLGADYNKNSVVDAADYPIWRKTVGSLTDLRADGDGNGTIDAVDYNIWRAGYGNVVHGGEIIMTGTSTLKANGALIGERTKGLLAVGPNAVVDIRFWDTIVEPNQFGGTVDMRVGGYGPAYDDFGAEPGLDGDGLVDVQGTLNAHDLYVSEHGAKGEIRLSGGTVNLNGELIMDVCLGCVTDAGLLALRSSKLSIVGSNGTFNVGLDPDPMVVDPSPTLRRDIKANSPTAIFSFTADMDGVTPIVVVENAGEISGNANINTATLVLNLEAYMSSLPLTLINAPNGHLFGTFGTVTFLGSREADVIYDTFNGNVFLNNFRIQNGAGAGAALLVGTAVPEPSSVMIMLTLGLLLLTLCGGANCQTAACRNVSV